MKFTMIIWLLLALVVAGALINNPAPRITLREWITPDPPDVNSLTGSVYVIEFWAMWCVPCVRSIPHLIELTDRYPDVRFIALSQDADAVKLRQFVRKHEINYHVAIDAGTVDLFEVQGYPTVFVVGHQGSILWRGAPAHVDFGDAIASAAAAASAAGASAAGRE